MRQKAMNSAVETLWARVDFFDGRNQVILIWQISPVTQALADESSPG
jgi:hypothetical protein